MRLHELTVTAFGPFAQTVRVDFDELGAAGLFLLTGKTGAGKTSVLDAVCFGLYGEVPGERAAARALRSDHAAPDVEPRVVLRLTLRGRTLRLSRTPAWDRPKRRGEGTRRIQASVVVEELLDGTWCAMTTRLDEAGQLVGELLGMTCTQFTQVALLPQGRFQTFLRASSAERHQVLQRLFHTSRFDDVERWLVEQRQQHRREVAAGHTRCTTVLDRICEATETELPSTWQDETPAGPNATGLSADSVGALVDDGSLTAWLDALQAEALTAQEQSQAEAEAADVSLATATKALNEAREADAARRSGEHARERLADLEAQAEDVERADDRLRRHRRAVPLMPLARRVGAAGTELVRARRAASECRDAVMRELGQVDTSAAALEQLRDGVDRRHVVAESWLPRERELARLRARRDTARSTSEALAARLGSEQGDLERRRESLARLDRERATLALGADRVPELTATATRLVQGRDAAAELETLSAELVHATAEQQLRRDQALDLKEAYLGLRERRISGMAAELATALAVGCSCPVCGSVEHPAPAARGVSIGKEAEEEARTAAESADVNSHAAGEVVAGLRSRVDALRNRTDDRSLAEWERSCHETDAELDAALADRDRLDVVDRHLAEARAEQGEVESSVATLTAELTAARDALAELVERVEVLAEELTQLLSHDDAEHETVAELVAGLAWQSSMLAGAVEAGQSEAEAVRVLAYAEASAREALSGTGFDSVETCVAAVLDDAVAHMLERRLDQWREARAEAERVLASPEVVAARGTAPVDLAEIEQTAARAGEARDRHQAGARAAVQRRDRLAALRGDLEHRLRAWQPARERHRDVAALSALVEGTSADNRLRMRLSGYVLAERLRQVVAAANERLARMTEQRFALEHSEERGAGEQRGGLSLRVRDDWSGTRRDPATLSGGESFVVSLSLALGLADTVSHESGGTEVETLFVDEGFGTLDADTLDAVVDVLDGLRDGGRMVGIVSHVAELRARVGAQLEVRKSQSGSTLAAVQTSA